MGNRTEYILSSMKAPQYDTSSLSNASNQFSNALNVGVNQMNEYNKGKSLAYANEYVSNLLGRNNNESLAKARTLLPYASESMQKQAQYVADDLYKAQQQKNWLETLNNQKDEFSRNLAEKVRETNLTHNYQMGSLGVQRSQLNELIRHNKAGEKALSDQYASALNTQLSKPVQAVYADKNGKVNVTTITTKMLLEHPDVYKSLTDYKAQKDQNLTPSQITQRDKIMSALQNEDPASKAQFKAYMNAYVNKDNHFIKTSIPSIQLDKLYNEYATAIKDQPWLMNTLISASGDANKGAEMFKMINRNVNIPEGFVENANRIVSPIRNNPFVGGLFGEVDPFGISKSAKEVFEERKNNKNSSYQKAKANGLIK